MDFLYSICYFIQNIIGGLILVIGLCLYDYALKGKLLTKGWRVKILSLNIYLIIFKILVYFIRLRSKIKYRNS